jgi:photosystem II stability/assembly factor-like uncharacterized protein
LGVRVVASSVISSLVSKRDTPSGSQAASGADQPTPGSRIQLSPATNNKLGVVYGSAFISPIIVDAKISTDQQTMWYVLALTEVTDTGTLTLGDVDSATDSNIFWGDKQLVFDTVDKTKVVKWVNSNGQEDTKCNGFLYMYLYNDGVNSGVNTGASATSIMNDVSIPADQRWNSSRYTYTGNAPSFYKTAFVIVKIIYNQDANITSLDQIKIKVTNSLTKPGSVIQDYLTNDRYGCAIPLAQVDTASMTALNNYSDQLITYTPVGGGSASQARYRVNGPIDTGVNCLSNLQLLADSCDSWLQWNEALAQWSIIPNRSYLDYTTYNGLFVIDSNNITSGVNITPIDLNSAYNIVETSFPNNKIKDQIDYNFVYLDVEDQNPNEPVNKLSIQLPLINDSVQAQYLATRRLIQSREDLIVDFSMDYSGIQINAGDVVRVRHPTYGWGPYPTNLSNPDKLFRVVQVQESKSDDGILGVRLSLMEYNEQVYQNINISDYEPAANTGLTDPTILPKPIPPTITEINTDTGTFLVNGTIPTSGSIIAIEFWYGPTATIINNNYKLWDTQYNSSGPVFPPGFLESTQVTGFPPDTFYWAVRVCSQTTKSAFSNSAQIDWSPAVIPARKICENLNSTTVTYSDTYKLWNPNTRGVVLDCEYDPVDNGVDVGGSPNNKIEIGISGSVYSTGTTDGLLLEVWQSNFNMTRTMQDINKNSNGYVIACNGVILWTGTFAFDNDPNTIVYNPFVVAYTASPSTIQFRGVATNGSVFCVAATDGKIYRSTTGYDGWTAITTPASTLSQGLLDITYHAATSTFIAVGGTESINSAPTQGAGNGIIIISTDGGLTWTQKVWAPGNNIFNAVATNGTQILVLGYCSYESVSDDGGVTWTTGYPTGGGSVIIDAITFNPNNSLWIVAGSITISSVLYSRIFTRPTSSSTYTQRYASTVQMSFLRGISFTGNTLGLATAVGGKGEIVNSTDGGITWTVNATPYSGTYLNARTVGNDLFLIGDTSNGYFSALSAPPFRFDITSASPNLNPVWMWETFRVFNYGSSPSSAYDNTIQPAQDQLPNNIPINLTYNTGTYLAEKRIKFLLVAGNLRNPTTPVTTYASRRGLSITEYRG